MAGLAIVVFGMTAAAGAAQAQAFAAAPQGADLAAAAFARSDWRIAELPISERDAGPIDSLRLSTAGLVEPAGGLPLNLDRPEFADRAYDVSLIRQWPGALRFEGGRFDIDLSPHAGLGVGNRGGSAEAGAELRLESRDDKAADRLRAMGVKDGAAFGDQGRWYLFAAASGRAVGLNMLRSENGWDGAGWSTDPTAALIGDAHVGVGYRKGSLQTSLGFIHREVRGQHMVFGQETKEDSVVAFSLTIKPRVR